MKRLAIITTHPIQYNAPLFTMLAQRKNIELKVFYTWSQAVKGDKYDPEFGSTVKWDIPLLEGYEWEAVLNSAKEPGSSHYSGIKNPALVVKIKYYQPNAILVYGWNFKSHFQVMRTFKGKVPLLFRGDSTLLQNSNGFKNRLRQLALKYVYHFIDTALYAGKANYDYFKFAGLGEKQLVFMPHAVDNKRFESTAVLPDELNTLRKEFNIPADKIILLFSGKLNENKNIASLCAVVAELQQLPICLLIVGSGKLEQGLKNIFGNMNAIRFVGFQNQQRMPAFYNLANVIILPSTNETWGLSLNEAMAAGKVVLATDGCGAAYDLIEQGVNGFMYPANNLQELKEHICWLVKNRDKILGMGEESKRIISKYCYEQDCVALEDLMENRS